MVAITERNWSRFLALPDLSEESQSWIREISSSTARSLLDRRVPLESEGEEAAAGAAEAAAELEPAAAAALAEEEDAAVEVALLGRRGVRFARRVPPPALRRAETLFSVEVDGDAPSVLVEAEVVVSSERDEEEDAMEVEGVEEAGVAAEPETSMLARRATNEDAVEVTEATGSESDKTTLPLPAPAPAAVFVPELAFVPEAAVALDSSAGTT